MTYKEALDCELDSKKMLNDFPNEVMLKVFNFINCFKVLFLFF